MERRLDKSSDEDGKPPRSPDASKKSDDPNTSSMAESSWFEVKKTDSGNISEYGHVPGLAKESHHQTSNFLESTPSSSLFYDSEGEIYFDYDLQEFTSRGLIDKDDMSKWNTWRKRNSESEISGSESDSDSSKTLFMKSDSDTSIETVVDKKIETDFKDTVIESESLNTENSNNVTLEENVVVDSETAAQDDLSQINDDILKPQEVLEIKTDCDSGFSSQVDMTQFTADVMTLRHEIPLCDHKGTEPVTPTKQIYFSTSEGSIITFEYTMQDEITGNFDKFNNTCIDLVKKDCPDKMAQLVYQAGLKALNNDNRKHLCCVFMLDNDKGQIDKLFDSANNQVPETMVLKQNQAENNETYERSHNSNVAIPIIDNSNIINKAITKLLPGDFIQEKEKSDFVSGSWISNDLIKNMNLDYKDFSLEVDVRAKDLANNEATNFDTSSQKESRKKTLSIHELEQMKKELDLFFHQNKVIHVRKGTDIKSKSLQSKEENSNLDRKSPEHIDESSRSETTFEENKTNKEAQNISKSVNDLGNDLKEMLCNLKISDQDVNNESSQADVLNVSKKHEDTVIDEISEFSQKQDTLKTDDEIPTLNVPVHENAEKTLQEAGINLNKLDIKNPSEKSNKDNAYFIKKYPNVDVIEDFSKLIIGSVSAEHASACSSSKRTKRASTQQADENKNIKLNTQCNEKEKTKQTLKLISIRTRAHSLESIRKVVGSTLKKPIQVTETENPSQKQAINPKTPKSEESHKQNISSVKGEKVEILNLKKTVIDEKKSSENKEPLKITAPKEGNSKKLFKIKSVHEDSSKSKGNKLLEKVLNEEFHTVNHILHVRENKIITKTLVTPDTQSQDISVSNRVNKILKTELTSESVSASESIPKSLQKKEQPNVKISSLPETNQKICSSSNEEEDTTKLSEQGVSTPDVNDNSTAKKPNPETINSVVIESSDQKYTLTKELSSESKICQKLVSEQNEKQRLSSEKSFTKALEEKENQTIIVSSVLECSPKEQRKKKPSYKSETFTNSLGEKESSIMIVSSVSESIPRKEVQQKKKIFSEPETVDKFIPKATTQKESVITSNTNVQPNNSKLLDQNKESFTEVEVTENLLTNIPTQKILHRKRSSSCSRVTESLKVTFLSTNNQTEGSNESCSEHSEESMAVEEAKPQFVRSAIHLLNSADPPYTPYKIVWIKSIIKRIDKIGILECNVDIPPKIKPKPVDNTSDTDIRPIISRPKFQIGGLVAADTQNIASGSNAISETPNTPVRVWQPPTRDEYGLVSRPKKNYRLNADAEEYVPEIYNPNETNYERSPEIYMEFKPEIVKRPYRTVNPYDNPQNTRFLPKQQLPFFPSGVYVASNGNVRLNLRSFISIDITVDLGIRVTYPLSRIFLALSHNGRYAAMIHPYGRVYQYNDVIEANIYDEYTGACKVAKLTERAVYFSNDITNKVYLVDKYGTHRNRSASFFRLKEDFTSAILTQTGRHGTQYNEEVVRMLAGAKFETCGFNHIIIIKNIKIIQYPTGNLSIFRYDRRDHIQICPNEGHCKISTPNVHITGTVNVTDNKPHVFVRKDDKRISFSREKFFVRTDGQTAGYNSANEVFIDYPI